jgi:hypothetical protein
MHFIMVLFSCSSGMFGTPMDAVKERKMHKGVDRRKKLHLTL